MPTIIDDIIIRLERLKGERATWVTDWQDLANFCLPRKAFISTERGQSARLDFHRLFDSVAIRSLQIMAAGFHSHLTNPSSKWFSLATQDRTLMKSKDVKMWFKYVEDEIFSTLNTSNFDATIQEFYLDAGCFGTGIIFVEEDMRTRIRFASIPISEVFIEEDSKGRVVRLYRVFKYTAYQAYERWGERAGQLVSDAIKSKKYQDRFTFVHCIYPREEREAGKKDNMNMPYASIWFEKDKRHLIGESGFLDFPYAVGRFYKETQAVWGYSPAHNVLADIKLVNAEKKTLIRAAMKIVDPPTLLASRGFILPLNWNPSGINYFNPNIDISKAFRAMETKGNIPIGFEMVQDVKGDIEKGFFVPLFQAFSQITKQMTIPEVQRRISENMVLLGPVVGRFTQEVLDPIIIRVFNILYRNGVFPPPPAIIQNQEFDVIYISQLAKAQRANEIVSLERTLETVGTIAQAIPSVLDKIDADKAVDIVAEIHGTNPELIRDDEEVAEIRMARAEAEEARVRLEALEQGADIAKAATEAEKNVKEVAK